MFNTAGPIASPAEAEKLDGPGHLIQAGIDSAEEPPDSSPPTAENMTTTPKPVETPAAKATSLPGAPHDRDTVNPEEMKLGPDVQLEVPASFVLAP